MKLRLVRPLSQAIRQGQPWVYRDALTSDRGGQRSVCPASLLDEKGRWLARGTYDPESALAFRVWTRNPHEALDSALVAERLMNARRLRERWVEPGTTGFRVCHGEADGIPGLYADNYDGVLSLSTDGGVGKALEPWFVEGLERVWAPKGIVVRNRLVQGGAARVIQGEVSHEVTIMEGLCRYRVDVLRGQKTGFFLDQRPNRQWVAQISGGARVLNLFSYTGGFSVAAALGGATRVVSVDSAAPAVNAAIENFAINDIDATKHQFVCVDAFEFLESCAQDIREEKFDVVVCDPPAFAPSQKALAKAKPAYVRLNTLAAQAVAPGGILVTASCSSHVSPEMFVSLVGEALGRAGRGGAIVHQGGAGPDHPVRPGFPEGRYLTCLGIQLDG